MQKNHQSKIVFLPIEKSQKVIKDIKEDSFFIIFDFSNENNDMVFNFSVAKNISLKIIHLTVNYLKNKTTVFNIKQAENSCVNIQSKCFALKQSFSKILINSIIDENSYNIKLDQDIKGFIFDDKSSITATPSMLVGNNKIVANHAVSIGTVDPEKMFFLQSRGFKPNDALVILIKSEYEFLNSLDNLESKKIYNKINKIIKEAI